MTNHRLFYKINAYDIEVTSTFEVKWIIIQKFNYKTKNSCDCDYNHLCYCNEGNINIYKWHYYIPCLWESYNKVKRLVQRINRRIINWKAELPMYDLLK